jgi:hypothetical protein
VASAERAAWPEPIEHPAATAAVAMATMAARIRTLTAVRRERFRPHDLSVSHDRPPPAGRKAGIVLDVLVPVLIGAAILAFVILIFAASSTRAYS